MMCFFKIPKRNQVMAFYTPQDLDLIVPRDPTAIDQRPTSGLEGSIFSLAILLIVIAVAFGLYFL